MSSSCEMCGRNGTRCTSRGCVWPTVSGWSRPTHQKQYKVDVFLVDMSSNCEMCGRNGTRCASRGCVWPTVRGTSRPTCQKTIQSRRVSRRHVVELRKVWQEWDSLHIARVRLAERKRDLASYMTKAMQSPRLFLANMDFLVVDAAKCAA